MLKLTVGGQILLEKAYVLPNIVPRKEIFDTNLRLYKKTVT